MRLSIVTTLYYSEFYIREFYTRVTLQAKAITNEYEIIFVNDGSPDNSKKIVLELQERDPHVILVDLSRNFGHHKAIKTGLSLTEGDYVFLIDSDLEEDPELLSIFWHEMIKDKNADVVYGLQTKRKGGWFERFSGQIYYKFFSALTSNAYLPNTLTARLMNRDYMIGLRQFQEREADLWGLFLLTGFQQKGIAVNKASKGSTTYTLRRKLKIVINTITTLTHKPLFLIGITGLILLLLSILFGIYILAKYSLSGIVENTNLILFSIWFLGSLIISSLGIISSYLSKMFSEVKARPLSIIKHIYKK